MIQWVEKSDVGRVRSLNEDRSTVVWTKYGLLAIVADGMGGHQAGEVASQMAIDVIKQHMVDPSVQLEDENDVSLLGHAIEKANQEVYAMASSQEQLSGMGTTIVAALASESEIVVAHIGDSRAYLATEQSIQQLTEDHSLVNELIKQGQLNAEEAKDHPRRNVIMRALGTEQQVKVDINRHAWNDGDLLLLCSDGLSSLVDDEHIQNIIWRDTDLTTKIDQLVELANEAGGDDNITVVLLRNVHDHIRGNEVSA